MGTFRPCRFIKKKYFTLSEDVFYQVCHEKSINDAWNRRQVLYEGSNIIDGGDHIEEMVIVVYS